MRVLGSVALVLTGSAILVLFALPFRWLDRQHLLPGMSGMLFVLLAPVIIAWYHAGFYFVLIVTLCELTLVCLKPEVRRARVKAMAAVGVCALAFLYLYLSTRFNFH